MGSSSKGPKSGLTWRSFLGILYGAIILMPATVFTNLFTGMNLIAAFGFPAAGFVVAFLFSELARTFGKPLTKQEVFVIWSVSLIAAGEAIAITVFTGFYFRSLFYGTRAFRIEGVPLPELVPDWFAPPPDSPVIGLRTFFHSDWMMPLAIILSGTFLFWKVLHLLFGILCYQIFAVEEKLPFPTQQVAAEACITLAVRQKGKIRTMTMVSIVSACYAIILYFVPFVFEMPTIPMPWADLNRSIELFIPGASFGIGTDAMIFAIGMILPLNVAISLFVGSFSAYFVGNHILLKMGLFPDWRPGMDCGLAFQRSVLSFWAFPQIGLALAAGLVPLIMRPRLIVRALLSLRRRRIKGAGILPLKVVMIGIVVSTLMILSINAWLTDFPLYALLILVPGWAFISSLIMARGIGVSGVDMTVPYVTETVFTLTPYGKTDIWFAPLYITGGGGRWAAWYKIAELTDTSITSYIKAHLLAVPIAWAISFLSLELFWRIAPIPSAMYPGVSAVWPATFVIPRAMWITGGVATGMAPQLILSSFLLGAIAEITFRLMHIPFSVISSVVGVMTALPVAFTVLLGGIVGRAIAWRLGKEWWQEHRVTIAAGIFLGESVVVALAVAFAMVTRMMWILPY
ncbi:TPA: hypothetical protein EYP44_02195 [Candidatus Bathyarchaeota archaeon]|nr:hypothetical protein [Candidatus Bathyarchaeota archaeon]